MKQEIEMTTVWTQEGYPIEVAVDAIGKGKSKGGKGFKGKGQENMQCYNCHEFGHAAAQCPNAVKCNNCGNKGHKATDCWLNKKGGGPKGQFNSQGYPSTKGNFNQSKGQGKGNFNLGWGSQWAVSYTHLTLPTKRIV